VSAVPIILALLCSAIASPWPPAQEFVPQPPRGLAKSPPDNRPVSNGARLANPPPSPADTQPVSTDISKQTISAVHNDMTAADVLAALGKPNQTARQILYRRYREQWYYDRLPGVWIELDCFKGQDPYVISVHKPAASR
jgi:hypothetical protein